MIFNNYEKKEQVEFERDWCRSVALKADTSKFVAG